MLSVVADAQQFKPSPVLTAARSLFPGESKLADSAAAPSRGSRKRKVGKEDIVRIQKDGDAGE